MTGVNLTRDQGKKNVGWKFNGGREHYVQYKKVGRKVPEEGKVSQMVREKHIKE